jgi:hypothetical protein
MFHLCSSFVLSLFVLDDILRMEVEKSALNLSGKFSGRNKETNKYEGNSIDDVSLDALLVVRARVAGIILPPVIFFLIRMSGSFCIITKSSIFCGQYPVLHMKV